MNTSFFARQEAARRSSAVLVLYFTLAVLLILLLVDLLFGLAFWHLQPPTLTDLFWHEWTGRALALPLFTIGLGSLIGFFQMRTGGHAVAVMVNATPVAFIGGDSLRQRFINVVEEMAIASGTRVPSLYVMEREQGINAFVAGLALDDAVLVVTQGAIERLQRDELQGVIGHEFSHILNGDMRLNMRLVAVLTGLLIMGQTGNFLLQAGGAGRWRNGVVLAPMTVGLVLWPLGIAGLLAGRLIKAAISRQRETLADVSSVQFTRNPDGLAGALLKIRDQADGSLLHGFHAESMSHMCFGPAINLARWYATHPPIDERIEAIAPGFLRRHNAGRSNADGEAHRAQQGRVDHIERPLLELAPIEYSTASLAACVGAVTPAHVVAAASWRRQLPLDITVALQSSDGAQALLYALIAAQQKVGRRDVEDFFATREGQAFGDHVLLLASRLQEVGLPLVDLALPRLTLLDHQRIRSLVGGLQAFSRLDQRLSVFEFALLSLVRRHLLPGKPRQGNRSLSALREPFAVVVAVLLHEGSSPVADRAAVYRRAFDGIGEPLPLPAAATTGLDQFTLALYQLAALDAEGRQVFMARCAAVVQDDGVFSAAEYELLRVVGALVGCPLPLALRRPK